MPKPDPLSRLADAALKLLNKKAWRDLTLLEVAKAAKVPLAELQPLAGTKLALIGAILQRLGEETARRYRPDKSSASPRERVFDVAMIWFDVLASRKGAIRSLHDGLRGDPFALIAIRDDAFAASAWLLALAQADSGAASLKAIGLAAILARAIPVWLDDAGDLSKTMSRLDGDLARAEKLLPK
jgi:AcrR family transcriptional regulator